MQRKFFWIRRRRALGLGLAAVLGSAGCVSVKDQKRQVVSLKIRQARTATPEELRALVNRLAEVESLQATALDLDAQGGNLETETVEKYRSAPGYLFVARPQQIRLKVLVPVAKNTLFDMASDGQSFQIWYPRENKFFTGSTHLRRVRYEGVEKNPLSRFRPQHLVDAVLFETLPEAGSGRETFIYEEMDDQAKYYVLGVVDRIAGRGGLALGRRVWVERSEMQVVRQQYYHPDGSVLSDIRYGAYTPAAGRPYPAHITLERPNDKFSIALRLKTLRLNEAMPPNAFTLTRPPSVELVEVKSDEGPNPAEP